MKISTKIKTIAAGAGSVVASALTAGAASAVQVYCPNGKKANDLSDCDGLSKDNTKTDLMATVNTIINVIIGVVGFVAVIVIILGGVQYTTSAGDSGKVKKAKDTILYGIIGLVVALLAFAIVNFVLTSIVK